MTLLNNYINKEVITNCCGCLHWKDLPALAQAREGPAGARRGALGDWKVLHLEFE
jgi:hypothetical protein